MSEKRFKIIHLGNPYDFVVKDFETNKTYGTSDDDKNYLVDLLNEQQATIEAKNKYQRTLEAKIRRLKNRIKILEKAEGWQN